MLALATALATSAACSPAIAPRTADLADEGELSGAGRLVAWSFGTAQLSSRASKEAERVSTNGAEIPPEGRGFNYLISILGSWEFEMHYGLSRWAEIGASFGFQRVGTEIRFGLLDEDQGAPLSLAMAYGAYYSAIGAGPWARAGVDVSKRFGRVAPLLNVYVSRGASYHSSIVDVPGGDDCSGEKKDAFFPCGTLIGARWYETRLTASLGLAFSPDRRRAFVVGVVPHVILNHTPLEPTQEQPRALSHQAGLQIVLSAQVPGW